MCGENWETHAMIQDRKSVFITGAASGIGLASAERFASEGWFIGLADIDEPALERAVAQIGHGSSMALRLDVRDRADWTRELARFVRAAGGRLDALVNNAGVFFFGPFEDSDPEASDTLIDINVRGVINGSRAAIPYLKQTPGSVLINVASAVSIYGAPNMAIYSASKFAVRGLSEALDAELGPQGVRVACILPAVIDTPLLDKSSTPEKVSFRQTIADWPKVPPKEAADVIWKAASSTELYHPVGDQARALQLAVMPGHAAMRGQFAAG
jgi:NAD(P)-dependent dehydrogenase (short-subunit alcohol dehydrogenase family)